MIKLGKSFDVLFLGGGVFIVLVIVLVFGGDPDHTLAKQPISGSQPEKPFREPFDKNVKDSLYPGKPKEVIAQTSETRANSEWKDPDWLNDESGLSQPGNRSVPAPFQAGVVNLGENASLGGKLPFPEDNAWNTRIDDQPVDPLSDIIIAAIGESKNVHPDFGAGIWKGARIGIPYVVVDGNHKQYPIRYTAYGDESDPGPYPVPPTAPIEGDPNEDGDRHVIVIDRDNWKLYELFRAFPVANGLLWKAESGAIFDMNQHPDRPLYWTSADAAGLPVFPGLVRYDEAVELKEIRHALRFTVAKTRRAFVPPATHWASKSNDVRLPPLGMRVRLKKEFDISGFPDEVQVILTALKRYGMILADNGSDWFISGAPHPLWNDDNLQKLKQVKGYDFEVVLMEGIVEEH